MGVLVIVIGAFLLFALAFNGSVGETFVNYAFFGSGSMMIVTGILYIIKPAAGYTRLAALLALIAYGPMIWQRFQWRTTDTVGLVFDAVFMIILITLIFRSLNKARDDQVNKAV